MDTGSAVPLWAFLIAAIAGPIVGAGLTVLGTWLTNRHNSKENKEDREFQSKLEARKWRMDQRNDFYIDLINLLEILHTIIKETYLHQRSAEEIQKAYLDLDLSQANLRLYASDQVQVEVDDVFREFKTYIRMNDLTASDSQRAIKIDVEDWQVALNNIRIDKAAIHVLIREHLDSFE